MIEIINLAPDMTSNTTPSGEAFSDSVYSTSAIYQSWCGFSSLTSNAWVSARANAPHYLGYNFKDKEVKVTRYSVTSRKLDGNDSKTPPKTWNFEGSNNGTDWTVLDTQVNLTWTSTWEEKEFNILSEKQNHYLYYRIYITEGTTENFEVSIGLLKMFGYENPKRIILTNDNSHYSLSDNTLIHLPDTSPKNMILHGIEQGKEIQLDVPFTKHRYFNDTPVANVSGKVFTHDIGKINTLNIKEIRESVFVPVYYKYQTSMTSNTLPAPLVASASSTHSDPYPAWKAFNGAITDSSDAWISNGGYNANIGSEWIQIDYGVAKVVNTLFLTGRLISTIGYYPRKFEIVGSNDGKSFNTLHTVSNQTEWQLGEQKIFVFNNKQSFRYYRLNILEINTEQKNAYVQIGDILFGYKGEFDQNGNDD
ncbi:hypothetical protein B1B04_09170 [Lysinibacillus sp. KCTC 33748]|uniref:discoidin domain-containing protein n=1 Tax=unclassified Lysinibacillus TaxID=2636778 RepID=UPI0009A5DAAD|nr:MULTISPECIES: discoidin domain-containing protein [unclassified Lysinibacillus]OXS74287.1 hypothetical protein B1B04_09170 [Lysinibacillus sp. KCTC 33748]SKB63679.1 F5/8 type C domain-containing protein [Lysinibacillus sp. AC-3]